MMLLNKYFQISLAILTVISVSAFTLSDSLHKNVNPGPLLKDVNAEELRKVIESYEGEKVVLVNVWATWCAPCIEEIPDIVEIQRKYNDRLQVIFVSADFPDSRDKAKQFLEEQNVDWTTYFKTGDDQEFIEVVSDDWTGALPFSKILNKQGKVVASWEKSATFSKFDKHVKRALND